MGVPRRYLLGYLLAVAVVLLAVAVRWLLMPVWGTGIVFLLFHPAILLAAWYGGAGPGLLAVVLACGAAWSFLAPASRASWHGALAMVTFAVVNASLVAMVEALHRQRRRAEAARDAARVGEERLAAALDVGQVGVWDVDLTRHDGFWLESPFDRAEPSTRPGLAAWRSRLHPDDVARARQEFTRARDERRELRIEHRVILPNGAVRWIDARGRFTYDANGRATRSMGAFVDVTERKAAGEETRVNEVRFRSMMSNMGEGLYTVDLQGRITFMNAAAERMLGWRADELLGRDAHATTHAHDGAWPAADCPGLQVLRSGRPLIDREDVFRRRDGSCFPVLCSSSRAEIDGLVLGLVVVFRDVTEQRQALAERDDLLAIAERARAEAEAARDAAEAASHAKDSFLATISHELRTPLSPILAWVRMLRQGVLDGEKTQRAYEVIERSARTQAQLIEDLLDVSRIIAGRMRLEVRAIDLPGVIEKAVEVIRPAADAKGVRLQLALDGDAGAVLGDAERLQQVVWNLLANAVKFTPKGGRVHVVLERADSHAEIVVADTGQGIEPSFLPHVFDRFEQADGTTTRKYGGLGLGLAIVRHIVEAHGGNVSVESDGTGRGAVFTVRIPLMIQPAIEAGRRVPVAQRAELVSYARLDGVRILVVDDEPDSNEAISALLASRGAEVRVAGSAEHAREVLSGWLPDVLVSDIGMPGEDGYGLIGTIRQSEGELARMPAIALTAYASREDKIRVLTAGFHAHVPKPVDPAELVAVLANVARAERPEYWRRPADSA